MNPPPAFHVMAKPRGPICNLGCHYCYFLKKESLYPDSSFHMSDEILEAYTRQYIEAHSVPEVIFAWQGGEPTLMGVDFFRRAVYYQQKYQRPGMVIQNAFQTNGTNLNHEWAELFKQYNFLIGLSLDGPQPLHDAYRQDKGGRPTFERVLAGLELLKQHQVEYNILTTVHAANAPYPLEVYRFLRDSVGTQFIQFIPIVERNHQSGNQEGYQVTKRSVTAKQYGDFLISVFDEWVRRDIGEVYVQIFDVALSAWMGRRAGLCIFEPTCGQAMIIEHNGDMYACDHYVEPGYYLGNIQHTPLKELAVLEQQQAFGQAKLDRLPRYCLECEVRFICHGECPKNRIRKTPTGEGGLNYLCAGYKAFFKHIDRPMKLMAKLLREGRPPRDIMEKFTG